MRELFAHGATALLQSVVSQHLCQAAPPHRRPPHLAFFKKICFVDDPHMDITAVGTRRNASVGWVRIGWEEGRAGAGGVGGCWDGGKRLTTRKQQKRKAEPEECDACVMDLSALRGRRMAAEAGACVLLASSFPAWSGGRVQVSALLRRVCSSGTPICRGVDMWIEIDWILGWFRFDSILLDWYGGGVWACS
jgi:hypothetical protein